MGNTYTKSGKKLSFWKILLWIVGIFVALQIVSEGEFGQDLFGQTGGYTDATESTQIVYKTYIGISGRGTEDNTGIVVDSVVTNGPAEKAGIQPGDIITALGSYGIGNSVDFKVALIRYDPWETVEVSLIREGVAMTLSVTLGEVAEVVTVPQEEATQPQEPQGGTTPPQNVTTPPQNVTTPPQGSTGNQGNTGSTEVHDRFPSMPPELLDHVLIGSRDKGISATLTGNVLITVIFVNDPTSTWTAEKMASTKAGDAAMTAEVLAEAAGYGVDLNITVEYRQATVGTTEDIDRTAWSEQIMASAGLGSVATASAELERSRGVKEAPILFYLNTTDRAYALPNDGQTTEYAIIWNCGSDTITYRHELYHLFGAADYYFPKAVEESALRYYPNSTMLTGENAVTDNLTAYLIGWKDTLTNDALAFLQETAHLTAEYVEQEHAKEIYTGYVENWERNGYVITGYLDMGVLEGQGKVVEPNGNWKEGLFEYGIFVRGRCKILYENGILYEGEIDQGAYNGQGTIVWAGGDIYTGQWKDGQYHGNGKITYANGGWSEGVFENGTLANGRCKAIYEDGTRYEGDMVNGAFNGQGTIVWASGDSYTGSFVNGQFHGYGTYIWADGNSVSGTWNNGEFVG
jgi:hypothetical protein